MNKALVHLEEYHLSWDELKTLPEDHLAAVAVLSYAVSETNALLRIYLSQDHAYVEKKAINSASNIQRFVIIRSISSRLFELEAFLKEITGQDESKKDQLRLLGRAALVGFNKLKNSEEYELARTIRHDATNHYSFSSAKKNLMRVHKGADCNMYMHRMNGNCFYPFGEEVMFHARLNRRWANISSKKERDQKFKKWLDWTLKMKSWLDEVHANFTDELVFKPLGRNSVRKEVYWVQQNFVSKAKDKLTPIFLDKSD